MPLQGGASSVMYISLVVTQPLLDPGAPGDQGDTGPISKPAPAAVPRAGRVFQHEGSGCSGP
jgi:hypothetical protein